ncbi:hypothetical protein DXU93_10945 [Brumimicrobium aurantiacum]|uniref:Uncharacterized protein n=1 Tax=Brumimicrobium aurantiacum TaxID=1737063 RepID=A0A3E1EX08_9FLAO|nr:hypothetical protein DXU93_10945 [Brumimicrobium aurantiacum]
MLIEKGTNVLIGGECKSAKGGVLFYRRKMVLQVYVFLDFGKCVFLNGNVSAKVKLFKNVNTYS